jgi:SAM-dependent methyltransferase
MFFFNRYDAVIASHISRGDYRNFFPNVSTSKRHIQDIFKHVSSEVLDQIVAKEPRSGKVLDMGSGHGRTLAAIAVNYCLNGCGIDVRGEVVAAANRAYDELDLPCRAYHGNFFPPDFEVSEVSKWRDLGARASLDRESVYKRMGTEIDEFDVFVVYQYADNVMETLDLIRQRATPGAVVFVIGYPPRTVDTSLEMLPESLCHVDVGLEYSTVYRVEK